MIKLQGPSQILKKDETLQVFRNVSTTSYVDGKPVKREAGPFGVIGNVQPLGARDLMMVPEHDRFKEQFWVYLGNQQFARNKGLEIEGPSVLKINDRMVRLGVSYQVQSVENWGSYSKVRMMRIDVGSHANP